VKKDIKKIPPSPEYTQLSSKQERRMRKILKILLCVDENFCLYIERERERKERA
jgi:hypothetical protein